VPGRDKLIRKVVAQAEVAAVRPHPAWRHES
jgi:hypothetical protein